MNTELKTIFVLDDDSYNLEVAQVALETVGGLTVKTYAGARALLDSGEPAPDLLLSDYMMPEMDGEQALREFRKLPGWETVPVVFMTGNTEPAEIAAMEAAGAAAVIAKPIDPMKLADRIKEIWAGL